MAIIENTMNLAKIMVQQPSKNSNIDRPACILLRLIQNFGHSDFDFAFIMTKTTLVKKMHNLMPEQA